MKHESGQLNSNDSLADTVLWTCCHSRKERKKEGKQRPKCIPLVKHATRRPALPVSQAKPSKKVPIPSIEIRKDWAQIVPIHVVSKSSDMPQLLLFLLFHFCCRFCIPATITSWTWNWTAACRQPRDSSRRRWLSCCCCRCRCRRRHHQCQAPHWHCERRSLAS